MGDFLSRQRYNAPFFEGWYYKLVNATQDQCVVIIPGISCAKDTAGKCFIQVGHWPDTVSHCTNYPLTTLWSRQDGDEVCIGQSSFMADAIDVDIADAHMNLAGHVRFDNSRKLKETIISPGIMGPLAYLPNMQCNHGILSMDSDLSGQTVLNGRTIDFTGGKGYIEKDWGRGFPKEHLWLQCNHFNHDITFLTCAVAHIPTPFGAFRGFFCVVCLDNEELRFATYTGAKVSALAVDGSDVFLEITSSKKRIRVTSETKGGLQLDAPEAGAMVRKLEESLGANLMVEISDRKGNIIASATGTMAGVEAVGMAH